MTWNDLLGIGRIAQTTASEPVDFFDKLFQQPAAVERPSWEEVVMATRGRAIHRTMSRR
jgi:hypothetical protein